MHERHWIDVATYASGLEADIAVARLEAAGIVAMRDGHDGTAIFGLGFQGPTAFGVTVRVPSDVADEARALLADADVDADAELGG